MQSPDSLANQLFKEQAFAAKYHPAVPGIVPLHGGLFNLEKGSHLSNEKFATQVIELGG
jgi:hypothetical protein